MGTLISDDKDEVEILRGTHMVVGAVEILPPDVKLPLPKARTISQAAIRKYFGDAQLNGATFQPGGEPFALPVPGITTAALCGFCAENERSGHSVYCAACINERARAQFADFYGRELIVWHYLLIVAVGLLLIVGIVKYMPRPDAAIPVSVPVRAIQKNAAQI